MHLYGLTFSCYVGKALLSYITRLATIMSFQFQARMVSNCHPSIKEFTPHKTSLLPTLTRRDMLASTLIKLAASPKISMNKKEGMKKKKGGGGGYMRWLEVLLMYTTYLLISNLGSPKWVLWVVTYDFEFTIEIMLKCYSYI